MGEQYAERHIGVSRESPQPNDVHGISRKRVYCPREVQLFESDDSARTETRQQRYEAVDNIYFIHSLVNLLIRSASTISPTSCTCIIRLTYMSDDIIVVWYAVVDIYEVA